MVAVSVIVPVRNGAATLPACLDGLSAQLIPPRQTVVVDNGSDDGSAELAHRHPVGVHLVYEPRPGSYAARNAGLVAADGEVLAFTDADCVPSPEWLQAGLAALETVDIAAGHVSPLVSRSPSIWEKFDAGHHVDQRKYVAESGFGATANLLVRREVFAEVGPFDAALRSGGDREFCRRAVRSGFRLGYVADAVVRHQSRRSMRETWQLHRRLGAGLRELSKRQLHPPFWRDDQMLLPIGWAADTANSVALRTDGRPHRQREMLPLATVVVAARWTGRVTGR